MTVSRLDGSFGVGGLEAAIEPSSGALAGLVKTARQEWPEVECKAVDLDGRFSSVNLAAEWIVEQMLQRGPAEIGLTEAGARGIELEPMGVAGSNRRRIPILCPSDVVVISGGARGITAEVAVALASTYKPSLVLLGRTPAPEAEPEWLAPLEDEAAIRRAIKDHVDRSCPLSVLNERLRLIQFQREIRRTLERTRAAGSEVAYHSLDVRDRAAVKELVELVRRQSGPIRGLIHGAGVLADRRIEEQSDAQFEYVYDTKVEGLYALSEAIDPELLRFVVIFSSSTARFGRIGQAAYAAANETLNKWAQREARRRPHCRVVAFNWGPWDGGMVTGSLKPLFEREGLGLIPPEEGARVVIDELSEAGERPGEIVVLAESDVGDSAALPAGEARLAPSRLNGKLESVFQRRVDLESLPVIRSHVIDGHAVLPMALILEWLAEGALHRHPGMAFQGIDGLRLLKGVVLQDHKPATVSIRVGKGERRGTAFHVPVEMVGFLETGREVTHARGEAVVADRHASGERLLVDTELMPLATDREEIYRRILFHGPAMQAIQRVEGCDGQAIAGWVSTAPPPAAWIDKPLRQQWLTDPLAIDAAFQLLVLWSQERLGANSLPTAVGAYRQFRRRFPTEGVRVLACVRQSSGHRAIADIEFLDSEGHAVARIESYECVIDTSLNQAFRRNRLAHLAVAPS
jgi:NAD(P)-dependent dehydrogenase (short-subunit alcohol dehydrogenase family)